MHYFVLYIVSHLIEIPFFFPDTLVPEEVYRNMMYMARGTQFVFGWLTILNIAYVVLSRLPYVESDHCEPNHAEVMTQAIALSDISHHH